MDRLKEELDSLRPITPEQEARILQKFRLDWNYNSNAIEGNSLTLGETRSLLLHGLTAAGKPMRDHLDIKGHNEAVLGLEEFVRDNGRPLTEQFIREMHQVLLGEAYEVPAQTPDGQPTRKHIVPGQYKTSPNNVLTATGEMFYFASPQETPARMTELVDWYRQEDVVPTLHPAALAAEFHYRFVHIHPFDDGNGRMSRLLMNLILLRHGYPMTVIKAADRNRYLAALAEADAGEFEPFLHFVVENVEAGLRLMIRAANGEDINEPDDLDKKITLLKKQVLSSETAVKMLWGEEETQEGFYDAIIKSWLDELEKQTHGFNDLFMGHDYSLIISSVNSHSNKIERKSNIEEFKSLSRNSFLETTATIDYFGFSKRWNHFRQQNNGFDVGISFGLTFNLDSFSVTGAIITDFTSTGSSAVYRSPEIFTSLYKAEYDLNHIKNINHKLANKVYDFIATKVAEADTPPA
ncbi:Fic family protein [Hymenobacter algoricola]|uniref:Fic family protein n=1 Tax=Hymenobacter algoricola TaxID=486267 RepID=UPI0031EEAE6D